MTTFQGQLKSLQDNQKLLGILLFSFVTIIIWVALSLVSSQTKTAISVESQLLAKPLNPSINTTVLDAIEQKRLFQTSELSQFPIYIVYNERGNTSIFDRTDQTVTVQPDTLNNLNQVLVPDPSASSAEPASASATPSPQPTLPSDSLDTLPSPLPEADF